MRHDKAELLLRLALDMQGTAEGLSLEDIRTRYTDTPLSRRTAERLRDAVERLMPHMELANPGEVLKRWRIRSGNIRGLVQMTAEELAALQTAATGLRRHNLRSSASTLDDLHRKLAALLKPEAQRRLAPDVEFLVSVDGFGMQPGPRVIIPNDILKTLREAMLSDHRVKIHYRGRSTGQLSRQLVAPYGLLYGQRPYLVAYSFGQRAYRLWSLANIERLEMTADSFVRDPEFDLANYAARSFGVFQEEPVEVVLRFVPEAAAEASQFMFHPSQKITTLPDGALEVNFTAGGLLEMCWHLFTWGNAVEIVAPLELRKKMRLLLQESGQLLRRSSRGGK